MTKPHIVPKSLYFTIAAVLAVLLVVTVLVAEFDLGWLNTPAAMAIALVKAVLIVLYFMHVRYQAPLTRIFAAGGFGWLLILFLLTFADYLARPKPDLEFGHSLSPPPHATSDPPASDASK